jgi:hypothetical protein
MILSNQLVEYNPRVLHRNLGRIVRTSGCTCRDRTTLPAGRLENDILSCNPRIPRCLRTDRFCGIAMTPRRKKQPSCRPSKPKGRNFLSILIHEYMRDYAPVHADHLAQYKRTQFDHRRHQARHRIRWQSPRSSATGRPQDPWPGVRPALEAT